MLALYGTNKGVDLYTVGGQDGGGKQTFDKKKKKQLICSIRLTLTHKFMKCLNLGFWFQMWLCKTNACYITADAANELVLKMCMPQSNKNKVASVLHLRMIDMSESEDTW